jgi:predicted NUDIX family NTP pyrophosphohydrolase
MPARTRGRRRCGEFEEETGIRRPTAAPLPLGDAWQSSGKRIMAFAVEGELDVDLIRSNVFDLEWPPRSGRLQSFPEVDQAPVVPDFGSERQNRAGTSRVSRSACTTARMLDGLIAIWASAR